MSTAHSHAVQTCFSLGHSVYYYSYFHLIGVYCLHIISVYSIPAGVCVCVVCNKHTHTCAAVKHSPDLDAAAAAATTDDDALSIRVEYVRNP